MYIERCKHGSVRGWRKPAAEMQKGGASLLYHNRGSWPYFQNLKNVGLGETITYTTSLGTRTYRVTYSGRIEATDTSVLAPTIENRITMLTCVANEPSYRYCVIGQEIHQ